MADARAVPLDASAGTLPPAQTIRSRDEALDLIARAEDAIAALEDVLREETAVARSGEIAAALTLEARKSTASRTHLEVSADLRANAVALSRLAGDALDPLRQAQARLAEAVDGNLAVLATLRSVAEGLVRGVAQELANTNRAGGYAPPVAGRASPSRGPRACPPLLVSKRS